MTVLTCWQIGQRIIWIGELVFTPHGAGVVVGALRKSKPVQDFVLVRPVVGKADEAEIQQLWAVLPEEVIRDRSEN